MSKISCTAIWSKHNDAKVSILTGVVGVPTNHICKNEAHKKGCQSSEVCSCRRLGETGPDGLSQVLPFLVPVTFHSRQQFREETLSFLLLALYSLLLSFWTSSWLHKAPSAAPTSKRLSLVVVPPHDRCLESGRITSSFLRAAHPNQSRKLFQTFVFFVEKSWRNGHRNNEHKTQHEDLLVKLKVPLV